MKKTRITNSFNRLYMNEKGSPHLSTYLIYAASMAVSAGLTAEGLPVGITFVEPSYSEPTLLKVSVRL